VPEVVMGAAVLDGRTGRIVAKPSQFGYAVALDSAGGKGGQTNAWISIVADVDLDGKPELVTGNRAWNVARVGAAWSMSLQWENVVNAGDNPGGGDGLSAVADFFIPGHAAPQVVNVHNSNVYWFDGQNGARLAGPLHIPGANDGSNHGGPPNIADFDGDGRPEVALAGNGCYTVFDLDCITDAAGRQALPSGCKAPARNRCTGASTMIGILWDYPVQDLSSSSTGSSVFDFDGSGMNKVLYNDECFFRVFDGSTGGILMQIPNSSRTNSEYPLVVDVNGDRQSEIVLIANRDRMFDRDYCLRTGTGHPNYHDLEGAGLWCDLAAHPEHRRECVYGSAGITVFRDTSGKWVKTRPVWHQHAYHVTEIDIDPKTNILSVPRHEPNSWDIYNTYRKNVRGYVPLNAPDLRISSLVADLRYCPKITLVAHVVNMGSMGVVAGLPVSFYSMWSATAPDFLGTTTTTSPILPGGGLFVTFDSLVNGLEGTTDLSFRAIANDNGTIDPIVVRECIETNDSAETSASVSCNIGGG
jgi:hypothetical protein